MYRESLNSNLILLIRDWIQTGLYGFCHFKFQSDSINTPAANEQVVEPDSFKFQSDSINTEFNWVPSEEFEAFKFQSDSINTGRKLHALCIHLFFKFQSDSINTRCAAIASSQGISL